MPPTRATRVLKTKVISWIALTTQVAIQIGVATGSAPPGKGPWLLHWRLLAMAHMGTYLGCTIHILRRVDSWTEAQRADWTLAGIAALAPFNNLLSFFILPTFDVTRTSWPALVVYNMLLCGLMLHLPPMHVLVQLCIVLPIFTFLDFQKACSLARSSQQQLLGSSSSAAAQAALDDGRCPDGVATRYILRQGLPLLLLGVATATTVCAFIQRNSGERSRRALTPQSTKSSRWEAARGAHQPEHPDSAPPAAVPLESLGIYLISALGLRPLCLHFQSCTMRLSTVTQHVVLGAVCLPICAYYIIRTFVSRFEAKPFYISAEEVLVLIICSYVVGKDSSKLNMSGILQHIQFQLVASQALLVDLLPAHLVTRMLNSMEDTEQQGQQRSGGRKPSGAERRAPAATCGQLGPRTGQLASMSERRVSTPGQRESSSGQRVRPSPAWRRRPARRASSLLFSRLAAAKQLGRAAEAKAEAAACSEPPDSWVQGLHKDAPLGPIVSLEPDSSRQPSVSSCLGCEDLVQGSWGEVDRCLASHGGGSSINPAAAASGLAEAPPPAEQVPSLYRTFSRSLSAKMWSLPSQLAIHLSGGAEGIMSSPGTHTLQDQVQERHEVLSGCTTATAASHECVTLFFSDICGFSNWASKLPPEMVMSTLDDLYSRLDDLILNEFPGLYKVETVGDAYIVAANLLTPDPYHAATAVHFALRAQQETHKVPRPDRDDGETLEMRIGLHSGSIMSGIVGKIRRRFCLFGDTMNMAARTESSCPEGSVQLTAATYTLAQPFLREEVIVRERGEVQVKGSDKPLMMFLASAPERSPLDSFTLPDDEAPERSPLDSLTSPDDEAPERSPLDGLTSPDDEGW